MPRPNTRKEASKRSDDPVTLGDLADDIVTIIGDGEQAKKVVREVDQANSENRRYPATVHRGATFSTDDLVRMEAQELLDRAGSRIDAERVIDRLPS